jgi:hypothetical protein
MKTMKNLKKIKMYIREHPEAELYETKVFFRGRMQTMKVYAVPIKYIYPNPDNGRILSQKMKKEDELGYVLDPTDPAHQHNFVNMLLTMDERDKAFVEDLKVTGQKDFGAITAGGMAVNVNRRWATNYKLNQKHPGQYETLNVVILPENATAKDLYIYEVQQQIAPSHKREYTSLNELLKWRQGMNRLNFTEEELKSIFNWSKTQYEAKLAVLELMERFLVFIGKPKGYDLLEKNIEHFVDFYNDYQNAIKDGLDALELEEIVHVFFKIMETTNLDPKSKFRLSHRDHIRKTFQYAACNEHIFGVLTKNLYNPDATPEEILKDVKNANKLAKDKDKEISLIDALNSAKDSLKNFELPHPEMGTDDFAKALRDLKEVIEQFEQAS